MSAGKYITAAIVFCLIAALFFMFCMNLDSRRAAYWTSPEGQAVIRFYEQNPEAFYKDYDEQVKEYEEFTRKERARAYAER
jgi:hypothetical protein